VLLHYYAYCVAALSIGTGCRDELAAGPTKRGAGQIPFSWGQRMGSLCGERTKCGPLFRASGARVSWLGENGQRTVFRAERVGQR